MHRHWWKGALAGLLALAAAPALTWQGPAPVPAGGEISAEVPPETVAEKPQLTRPDVDAWLDGYLPYAMQRGDVAGAVVVVVKDGQVLTQRGYGYSDVAALKPVDPEATLFRPGSVSKLFTWTAIMQLAEQGKLDLDADVNTYLDFTIPPRDGKPITLRNILTHTSGFEEVIKGNFRNYPASVPSLGEVVKTQKPKRIFAPGTMPAYSNYATALAGYIVERVSGMTFDDYVDRNIFGRLGMARSTFRQPLPASLAPLMSKGYRLGSGEARPFEMISVAPAGALSATGADMAKFMIAHLNDGGALMKPETARLMHDSRTTIIPGLNRMALGFYEQNINGRRVIGHGGDTTQFHSYLWLFQDDDIGLFISLNSGGKAGVTAGIRDQLLAGFADRYFPAPLSQTRVDAATAAEHARMMVGTYNNSRRIETTFVKMLELLGGQLSLTLDKDGGIQFAMAQALGGQPRKWVEIEPFVWRDVDSGQRLAAKLVDGKVVGFSMDSVSPFMIFERVPGHLSVSWLRPALLVSLGALLLTAIAWPISALVRRRYGARLPFAGHDLLAYRLVRGFAAGAVAVVVGWLALIVVSMRDYTLLGGQLDWALVLLQISSLVAFFGLFAAALWNAWLGWKGSRSWRARLWSMVLVFAGAILLWVGLNFHMISFGTEY